MKEATFKKWHLISWEPEILISGGLILTLFNIKPRLVELSNIISPYNSSVFDNLILLLSTITATLAIGFTLHLIIRGLWMMKMGIAVTIKQPFDPEKFSFRSIYKNRISKIDLFNNAKKLGELSGFIFSITFFLMLLTVGFSFSLTILSLIASYFEISGFVILGLYVLLFIDFISFGYLKQTRLGVVLYPVLNALYLLFLSFLYKDIYYHLIQNVRRPKLAIGFFIFILLTLAIGYANVRKVMHLPEIFPTEQRYERYRRNVYEDERDPFFPYKASISSYYQEKDLLKLYVDGWGVIDNAMDHDAITISINGQTVTPIKIRNYVGQEHQDGYLYFLDISFLNKKSEHHLSIIIDNSLINPEFEDRYVVFYDFPFYKE